MFRCDNCGSGFSSQAASSWTSCPRCLAKERIQVPLTFELGWQRQREPAVDRLTPQAGGSREVNQITSS
jgi:DNA-directed RNA polymerase subunit RPC12/RpoP